MLIGVDFDNTIVRYDDLFHRIAAERGLITSDVPITKNGVRDYLRRQNNEDAWTELQGYVYGARMGEASAFPGAIEFLTRCRRSGIGVRIISHKTRHPFLGPQYDLHRAATDWLTDHGFFRPDGVGLSSDDVHFRLTKEDKLGRIGELGCSHFIDDLPEFLSDAAFPAAVERILFDPGDANPSASFTRVLSWDQLYDLLNVQDASDFREPLQRLLEGIGRTGEATVEPVSGGANNRVFRVTVSGERLLLKQYFHRASDSRDRLAAEFEFLRYGWEQGVPAIPRPIASDHVAQIALYEFVDGRRLHPGEVSAAHVREALDFYLAVNRVRQAAQGRLASASEACFSLAAHCECVGQRVRALRAIESVSPIDQEAVMFVSEQLQPTWARLLDQCRQRATALDENWDNEIPLEDRRLSPSDFGFHNALASEGRLVFMDFEYAGWDDPAKLVSDFFCQPAVPVPLAHREEFTRVVLADLADPESCAHRLAVIWPVYQLKWVCIILNEFLPLGNARRRFARPDAVREERKAVQLRKARETFNAVRTSLLASSL